MKYRNVFIDLDDTLWDFKSSSAVALKNLYDKYDLDRLFPSFEEFRGLYMRKNHELWELYHHGSITKDELIVERFRFLLKQSGYQDGEDRYALELNESYLIGTNIIGSVCHRVVGIFESKGLPFIRFK